MSLFLPSCSYLGINEEKKSIVLAQVEDEELTLTNAELYIPDYFGKEDSLQKLNKYVDSWIIKNLIINKSKENEQIDFETLEQKAEKLKEDLIVHEYNKNLIYNELDTNITNPQIEAYYNKHKQNFVLKEKIIQGFLIKIKNTSPLLNQLKKVFLKNDSTAIEELKEMAQSQATDYMFMENKWIPLNEVLVQTPFFQKVNDTNRLLKDKKLIKEVEQNVYFIRLLKLKNEKEISPLEQKKETIKHIILNERKQTLINSHRETLYLNATKNSEYKRY